MEVKIGLLICCCAWRANQIEISLKFKLIFHKFSFFAKINEFCDENCEYDPKRRTICENAPRIWILPAESCRNIDVLAQKSISKQLL